MNPFSRFPEIKTEDILLRRITQQDLDALCVIYQNPNVFRYIPGDAKKSRETVRHLVDHFERDFRKGKELFLGICLPEYSVKPSSRSATALLPRYWIWGTTTPS